MTKWIKPVVVIFIFIAVTDWLIHGCLLKSAYEATASAWRTPEDMQKHLGWMFFGQFLVAVVTVMLFCQIRLKEIEQAPKTGALLGLLYGVGNVIMYAVAPYSLSLVLYWIIFAVIQYAIIAILWVLFKPSGFDEYIE